MGSCTSPRPSFHFQRGNSPGWTTYLAPDHRLKQQQSLRPLILRQEVLSSNITLRPAGAETCRRPREPADNSVCSGDPVCSHPSTRVTTGDMKYCCWLSDTSLTNWEEAYDKLRAKTWLQSHGHLHTDLGAWRTYKCNEQNVVHKIEGWF